MFGLRQSKLESTDKLDVAGINIKIIRSRRKTIALQIQNGEAVLRSPIKASITELEYFAHKHQHWLQDKLAQASQRISAYPDYALTQGSQIDILGKAIGLRFCQTGLNKPELRDETLHVPDKENGKHQIQQFLRQLSLETAQQLTKELALDMGVKPKQVKVREYKRRWGTCHSDQSITLNWRLIMAPKEIYEYVIVHELAHLTEFNHSKRFWQIVQSQKPDWREDRNWLEQHGLALYRI
jgi:predicted metal-dependent hydrolase